jgi:enamine deaminase RidA (YjgF/YER057c/UK114 family)
MRQNYSSGTVWEDKVGYSRCVRIGNFIKVSGTTAVNEKGEIVDDSVYEQCHIIFKKIEHALVMAGSTMDHVVTTRIYLTDINGWEEAGKAHSEVFDDVRPAATLVAVSALIDPRMLVEIEVEAFMHY